VLWLDFLEPSGSVVCDKSGYGNHGTIYGAQRVRTLGRYGLSFDGVDDYVEVPHSEELNPTDSITLMALVYTLGDSETYRNVVRKEESYLLLSTLAGEDTLASYIYTTAWQRFEYTAITLPDILNKWVHVAMTYDRTEGKVRLWVNGELDSEYGFADPINVSTNPVNIGGRADGNWWYGLIALVRIYNRALSEREIKANYAYFFSHLKGEV